MPDARRYDIMTHCGDQRRPSLSDDINSILEEISWDDDDDDDIVSSDDTRRFILAEVIHELWFRSLEFQLRTYNNTGCSARMKRLVVPPFIYPGNWY